MCWRISWGLCSFAHFKALRVIVHDLLWHIALTKNKNYLLTVSNSLVFIPLAILGTARPSWRREEQLTERKLYRQRCFWLCGASGPREFLEGERRTRGGRDYKWLEKRQKSIWERPTHGWDPGGFFFPKVFSEARVREALGPNSGPEIQMMPISIPPCLHTYQEQSFIDHPSPNKKHLRAGPTTFWTRYSARVLRRGIGSPVLLTFTIM